MLQIKALNLSLIKGAAEVEKQNCSAQMFRFIITIIIIILTRVVGSNKKNRLRAPLGKTPSRTQGTPLAQWEAGDVGHLGTPPHLT